MAIVLMHEPRVLVLLTTYNGATWIEQQLASVLEQNEVSVAVSIADDGSTDGTQEILRDIAMKHRNVKLLIRPVSTGSAGANFRSLLAESDFSAFDYVALADHDDIWDLNHLAAGCAALTEAPTAAGYSCAVRTFGAGEDNVLSQSPTLRSLDFLFEGAGQGCTFIFRRELAEAVSSLCRTQPDRTSALHYHDWLIYLVARSLGWEWIFDGCSFVRYRQHGGNEIGARSSAGGIHKRFVKIRNGWYRGQIQAALDMAIHVDRHSSQLKKFSLVFHSDDSITRRLRLAWWAFTSGRRKSVERGALSVFALLGWI